MRRLLRGVALLALLLVLATLGTLRFADGSLFPPRPGDAAIEVRVVDHGYHAGVVLPRAALADVARDKGLARLADMTARFAGYAWVEIGWGDEHFYRFVPTTAHLAVGPALRAMLGLNDTAILHVVGFDGDPARVFHASGHTRVRVSAEGFARLAAKLDATFAPDETGRARDVGAGLYGPSLFYAARGRYHAGSTCNHWIADLLAAAGLPTSPVLATWPATLRADLRWRAGAE